MKPTVAIGNYTNDTEALKKTIELCKGFEHLNPSDKVMIKPNLVAWDDQFPIAPFGVYTSTRLMEDLIIALKDFGCATIAVGEGSVQLKKGMGTMAAFEGLGYPALKKRYGIEMIDFNESEAEVFNYHDDMELHIAKEALENDFFINFQNSLSHNF